MHTKLKYRFNNSTIYIVTSLAERPQFSIFSVVLWKTLFKRHCVRCAFIFQDSLHCHWFDFTRIIVARNCNSWYRICLLIHFSSIFFRILYTGQSGRKCFVRLISAFCYNRTIWRSNLSVCLGVAVPLATFKLYRCYDLQEQTDRLRLIQWKQLRLFSLTSFSGQWFGERNKSTLLDKKIVINRSALTHRSVPWDRRIPQIATTHNFNYNDECFFCGGKS